MHASLGCGERCPYCNENIKGRCNHRGHRGYRAAKRKPRPLEYIMRRVSAESGRGDDGSIGPSDDTLSSDHPLLHEHLVTANWEDGSERETSTLLLFVGQGAWKACLNNRSEGLTLWASGSSLAGAMEALERALDTSAPDWRRNRPGRGQKK